MNAYHWKIYNCQMSVGRQVFLMSCSSLLCYIVVGQIITAPLALSHDGCHQHWNCKPLEMVS